MRQMDDAVHVRASTAAGGGRDGHHADGATTEGNTGRPTTKRGKPKGVVVSYEFDGEDTADLVAPPRTLAGFKFIQNRGGVGGVGLGNAHPPRKAKSGTMTGKVAASSLDEIFGGSSHTQQTAPLSPSQSSGRRDSQGGSSSDCSASTTGPHSDAAAGCRGREASKAERKTERSPSGSRSRRGASQSPLPIRGGRRGRDGKDLPVLPDALGGSVHSTGPRSAKSPSQLRGGRRDDALGGSLHSTAMTGPRSAMAGWRLREAMKLERSPSSSSRNRGGRSPSPSQLRGSRRDDAKGQPLLPAALQLAAQKSPGALGSKKERSPPGESHNRAPRCIEKWKASVGPPVVGGEDHGDDVGFTTNIKKIQYTEILAMSSSSHSSSSRRRGRSADPKESKNRALRRGGTRTTKSFEETDIPPAPRCIEKWKASVGPPVVGGEDHGVGFTTNIKTIQDTDILRMSSSSHSSSSRRRGRSADPKDSKNRALRRGGTRNTTTIEEIQNTSVGAPVTMQDTDVLRMPSSSHTSSSRRRGRSADPKDLKSRAQRRGETRNNTTSQEIQKESVGPPVTMQDTDILRMSSSSHSSSSKRRGRSADPKDFKSRSQRRGGTRNTAPFEETDIPRVATSSSSTICQGRGHHPEDVRSRAERSSLTVNAVPSMQAHENPTASSSSPSSLSSSKLREGSHAYAYPNEMKDQTARRTRSTNTNPLQDTKIPTAASSSSSSLSKRRGRSADPKDLKSRAQRSSSTLSKKRAAEEKDESSSKVNANKTKSSNRSSSVGKYGDKRSKEYRVKSGGDQESSTFPNRSSADAVSGSCPSAATKVTRSAKDEHSFRSWASSLTQSILDDGTGHVDIFEDEEEPDDILFYDDVCAVRLVELSPVEDRDKRCQGRNEHQSVKPAWKLREEDKQNPQLKSVSTIEGTSNCSRRGESSLAQLDAEFLGAPPSRWRLRQEPASSELPPAFASLSPNKSPRERLLGSCPTSSFDPEGQHREALVGRMTPTRFLQNPISSSIIEKGVRPLPGPSNLDDVRSEVTDTAASKVDAFKDRLHSRWMERNDQREGSTSLSNDGSSAFQNENMRIRTNDDISTTIENRREPVPLSERHRSKSLKQDRPSTVVLGRKREKSSKYPGGICDANGSDGAATGASERNRDSKASSAIDFWSDSVSVEPTIGSRHPENIAELRTTKDAYMEQQSHTSVDSDKSLQSTTIETKALGKDDSKQQLHRKKRAIPRPRSLMEPKKLAPWQIHQEQKNHRAPAVAMHGLYNQRLDQDDEDRSSVPPAFRLFRKASLPANTKLSHRERSRVIGGDEETSN